MSICGSGGEFNIEYGRGLDKGGSSLEEWDRLKDFQEKLGTNEDDIKGFWCSFKNIDASLTVGSNLHGVAEFR